MFFWHTVILQSTGQQGPTAIAMTYGREEFPRIVINLGSPSRISRVIICLGSSLPRTCWRHSSQTAGRPPEWGGRWHQNCLPAVNYNHQQSGGSAFPRKHFIKLKSYILHSYKKKTFNTTSTSMVSSVVDAEDIGADGWFQGVTDIPKLFKSSKSCCMNAWWLLRQFSVWYFNTSQIPHSWWYSKLAVSKEEQRNHLSLHYGSGVFMRCLRIQDHHVAAVCTLFFSLWQVRPGGHPARPWPWWCREIRECYQPASSTGCVQVRRLNGCIFVPTPSF